MLVLLLNLSSPKMMTSDALSDSKDFSPPTQLSSLTMPLVSSIGQNTFNEFYTNYPEEVNHSYIFWNLFKDAVGCNCHMVIDDIALHTIQAMDNSTGQA